MLRLFIGITLQNHPFIAQYQQKLKTFLPKTKASWVPPDNFHVTLKFLGKTEAYFLNSIKLVLKEICLKNSSFFLEYNKPGYFGTASNPKVLWFGFKQNPVMEQIQQSIDTQMADLGFEMEKRSFTPHVTLARIKHFNDDGAWLDFINTLPNNIPEPQLVNSIQLYESQLSERGARYKILENYKLEMDSDH